MLYKLASLLAATAAAGLEEITDDFTQDSHKIWDSYMEKEEEVYDWFVREPSIKSVNGGTLHFLNVTSLQWMDETKAYGPNGATWSHIVAINVPKNLKHTNISAAMVVNGFNYEDHSDLPPKYATEIMYADELAHMAEMITITIYQVPNGKIVYPSDPSHKRRGEDQILAWAWREYHEDPTNFEWLPRMPMAKAAFQAMRAS